MPNVKHNNNQVVLEEKRVPIWLSVSGIVIGVFFVVFTLFGKWWFVDSVSLGNNENRLAYCIGLALILSGFGTQASGTWKNWSVAGAGAAAIILYLLLWYTGEGGVGDQAIVARIEGGFRDDTKIVQVESPSNETLYTKWNRVGRSLKVRIEESHLKDGCIVFVDVVASDNDGEPIETFIPTSYFNSKFQKLSLSDETREVALLYDHKVSLIFDRPDKKYPISFKSCPIESGYIFKYNKKTYLSYFLKTYKLLISVANASGIKLSIEELLPKLKSNNALVRRESRQFLSKGGVNSVRPIMNILKNKKSNRLQIGAVVSLSNILKSRNNISEIRGLITNNDINILVNLISNKEKALRVNATKVIIRLADPKAVHGLVDIVVNSNNRTAQYNSALILNETFETYDESTRRLISTGLSSLTNQPGVKTRKLLEPLLTPKEGVTISGSKNKTGWTYVGANYGSNWDEKYFTWTGRGVPKVGDVLTATGSVNLRANHIEYIPSSGWVNSPVLGVIREGDKVHVVAHKDIAGGFHWVKVVLRN